MRASLDSERAHRVACGFERRRGGLLVRDRLLELLLRDAVALAERLDAGERFAGELVGGRSADQGRFRRDDRRVLVEGDAADCLALDRKAPGPDRLDADRSELLSGELEDVGGRCGPSAGTGGEQAGRDQGDPHAGSGGRHLRGTSRHARRAPAHEQPRDGKRPPTA